MDQSQAPSYLKFFFMLAISFLIMYGVMFLNVDKFDHVYTSLTGTYMTILMIAPMAILKMVFMWEMYHSKKINLSIIIISSLVFIITLYLLRTQKPIGDVQWMEAMIPHHSSAILTSSNASFEDPEVQKLADEIIQVQIKEIEQMKSMINRLENK